MKTKYLFIIFLTTFIFSQMFVFGIDANHETRFYNKSSISGNVKMEIHSITRTNTTPIIICQWASCEPEPNHHSNDQFDKFLIKEGNDGMCFFRFEQLGEPNPEAHSLGNINYSAHYDDIFYVMNVSLYLDEVEYKDYKIRIPSKKIMKKKIIDNVEKIVEESCTYNLYSVNFNWNDCYLATADFDKDASFGVIIESQVECPFPDIVVFESEANEFRVFLSQESKNEYNKPRPEPIIIKRNISVIKELLAINSTSINQEKEKNNPPANKSIFQRFFFWLKKLF